MEKLIREKIAAAGAPAVAEFLGVSESALLAGLAPKVGEASWEGRRVCIMLPFYRTVTPATAYSIMACLDRSRMMVMLDFGDAFVAHTRNKLASEFLKTDAEWGLTIDDDSILPCGNASWYNGFTGFNLPEKYASFNTVTRLMSHGKTLVGGLYFGRWKHGKPVFGEGHLKKEEAYARSGPHDTCIPTRWVGTGCLLVHRSVFLDIEKKFPHLSRAANGGIGQWFSSGAHDLRQASQDAQAVLSDRLVGESDKAQRALDILTAAQHKSEKNSPLDQGEDVSFCIRASQAGHQPHVDMGLIVGHQGSFVFGPKKVGYER